MKKLISLTLAFAMLLAIAVPASATNSKNQIELLERKEVSSSEYHTISKLGNTYYYFKQDNGIITSIAYYPDGTIDKYVRNIDSYEAEYYIANGNFNTFSLASDDSFELVEIVDFNVRPSNNANVRSDMDDEMIDQILNRLSIREGSPYYARNIAGYSGYGTSCTIYETHSQSVIEHGDLYFNIGTSLVRIATGTGVPVEELIGLFIPTNAVDLAEGIITQPISLGSFSARAMFTRFANIAGETYYSVGKTITYLGVYNAYAWIMPNTKTTRTDSYFDNLAQIAEMAFYYYMGY